MSIKARLARIEREHDTPDDADIRLTPDMARWMDTSDLEELRAIVLRVRALGRFAPEDRARWRAIVKETRDRLMP